MPVYADATFVASYEWTIADPAFGGFSGIEVSDDGAEFVALSDRGTIMRGAFQRQNGTIVGIEAGPIRRLRGAFGIPLDRANSDSEGLAIAADGLTYISFEWMHGLRAFDDGFEPASDLITNAAFAGMQDNASLEALAVGPNGALYTMPERSGRATEPFPVFRFDAGHWDQPFTIPRRGPFVVSGADIGPDGLLYVLERDFVGIGFRNRVRRFALDGSGEKLVFETGLGTHDNLEGISVWQDASGLRMTLISDDNFRMFQRTEVVEYQLTD
ncbi:esterase-like activity of phytase family protein [Roseobacter sp. CCS2]|uniref:esterase-like activity of phytase family protein n=1 Tax=Roseobacter sp. CCS2 TaxID=391593 RepID=UPI0002F57650|nr:esterase-like activity of phytase family protein [Roseobacter sp. CCS2]